MRLASSCLPKGNDRYFLQGTKRRLELALFPPPIQYFKLADFPRKGQDREDHHPNVRTFPFIYCFLDFFFPLKGTWLACKSTPGMRKGDKCREAASQHWARLSFCFDQIGRTVSFSELQPLERKDPFGSQQSMSPRMAPLL